MRVQNEQHFSSTSAKISGETLRSDAPEKLDRHELLSLYCADVRDASRLKEHVSHRSFSGSIQQKADIVLAQSVRKGAN